MKKETINEANKILNEIECIEQKKNKYGNLEGLYIKTITPPVVPGVEDTVTYTPLYSCINFQEFREALITVYDRKIRSLKTTLEHL